MALPNMPAHNQPQRNVRLGAGMNSSFGSKVNAGAAQQAAAQKRNVGKPHMPTHNNGQAKINMGTTKHGVGQVPGYLRAQ